MTTCTQAVVGSVLVLTLTACGGGGGGSSEPAQASAIPDSIIEWQGDWQADKSYELNDVVNRNGQAYIYVLPASGSEDPLDNDPWELMVDRGETGSIGPQGVAGLDGAAGPTGPAGPQGIAGAIGPAGPESLVWQGAYTGGNSYQVSDVVSFNGSAYISIQDTTGTEDPSDTSYWELLAEKGTDGSAGPQGPTGVAGNDGATGPQGIAGADGAVGPTGPAGTQGVAGATGPAGPQGADGASLPEGIDIGDLLYWDGTMWNLTPAPPTNPTTPPVLTLDSGVPTWTAASSGATFVIGGTGPAGGLVFYITDDGLHGLEAAPEDQATRSWGCGGAVTQGADGIGVGSGLLNTIEIIQQCGSSTAAQEAYDYELNGYFDWYLPSLHELNLMYDNLGSAGIGGFTNMAYYWASTEHTRTDINWAYRQMMVSGIIQAYYKTGTNYVRAIRTF